MRKRETYLVRSGQESASVSGGSTLRSAKKMTLEGLEISKYELSIVAASDFKGGGCISAILPSIIYSLSFRMWAIGCVWYVGQDGIMWNNFLLSQVWRAINLGRDGTR
ncbi:hypothetical protein Ddye_032223 [Dipteronia dyeriana]|uniref:Uncharacterized protein n=1 Tax=Dipteronia dyeriana TaxID=168575 RepID=A0AAD9TKG3_9ROSI|nr:hypothetical protein Ddye_032223 [Dipteronia dyeriana]